MSAMISKIFQEQKKGSLTRMYPKFLIIIVSFFLSKCTELHATGDAMKSSSSAADFSCELKHPTHIVPKKKSHRRDTMQNDSFDAIETCLTSDKLMLPTIAPIKKFVYSPSVNASFIESRSKVSFAEFKLIQGQDKKFTNTPTNTPRPDENMILVSTLGVDELVAQDSASDEALNLLGGFEYQADSKEIIEDLSGIQLSLVPPPSRLSRRAKEGNQPSTFLSLLNFGNNSNKSAISAWDAQLKNDCNTVDVSEHNMSEEEEAILYTSDVSTERMRSRTNSSFHENDPQYTSLVYGISTSRK